MSVSSYVIAFLYDIARLKDGPSIVICPPSRKIFSLLFFFPFFPDRGDAVWQWKSTEAKSVLFFLCPVQLRYSGTCKATLLKWTTERNPTARWEMSIFLDLWFAVKTNTNDNKQFLSIAIWSMLRKCFHSQIQIIHMISSYWIFQ